jgi:23S rRNA (cytosine1962-C5)-methyltransferase
MKTHIFITEPQKEFALIDSGDGMKLERYGDAKTGVRVARPDPQALWRKQLPESWAINFGDLNFNIKLKSFKHTGIFPEQHNNWLWCREIIKDTVRSRDVSSSSISSADAPISSAVANSAAAENLGTKPTVLNLFGYTGGATVSAALGGAEVTHVDASRSSVTWANENAKSSGLEAAPIRWILDDALAFVRREVRRGKKYDAIIMDPPAFGRGAKGEIWKIEDDFLDLFETCLQLLSDDPMFVVLNGYAAGYSSIAYENNMQSLIKKFGGTVESGELTLREEGPAARLLPCGIVSRWKK